MTVSTVLLGQVCTQFTTQDSSPFILRLRSRTGTRNSLSRSMSAKLYHKAAGRGGSVRTPLKGKALQSRLSKHARSIEAVSNLDISDFCFRSLVVDDIWIPLGENVLIEQLKPLWNLVVEGFGINDPGSGRHNQARSQWDTLHPGRGYADKLQPGKNKVEEIENMIAEFFR